MPGFQSQCSSGRSTAHALRIRTITVPARKGCRETHVTSGCVEGAWCPGVPVGICGWYSTWKCRGLPLWGCICSSWGRSALPPLVWPSPPGSSRCTCPTVRWSSTWQAWAGLCRGLGYMSSKLTLNGTLYSRELGCECTKLLPILCEGRGCPSRWFITISTTYLFTHLTFYLGFLYRALQKTCFLTL